MSSLSLTVPQVFLGSCVVQAGLVHAQAKSLYAFELMHRVQRAVDYLNIGAVCYQIFHVLAALESRHRLVSLAFRNQIISTVSVCAGTVAVVGWLICAIELSRAAYHFFNPAENWRQQLGLEEEDLAGVVVENKQPVSQAFTQIIYLAQITACAALACLKISPYFYLACAATQAYSYFKTAQWQWICLVKTASFAGSMAQTIKISYFWALQKLAKMPDEMCVICQENEPEVKAAFCSSHVFHPLCMLQEMNRKSSLQSNFLWKMTAKRDDWGELTDVAYLFTASEKGAPACPTCRHQPAHNKLEIWVKDVQATVKIVSEEEFQRKNYREILKPKEIIMEALHVLHSQNAELSIPNIKQAVADILNHHQAGSRIREVQQAVDGLGVEELQALFGRMMKLKIQQMPLEELIVGMVRGLIAQNKEVTLQEMQMEAGRMRVRFDIDLGFCASLGEALVQQNLGEIEMQIRREQIADETDDNIVQAAVQTVRDRQDAVQSRDNVRTVVVHLLERYHAEEAQRQRVLAHLDGMSDAGLEVLFNPL